MELPAYALRKGRLAEAAGCAACAMGYWAGLLALWRHVNPVATLWVLLVPFFVSTFALMFGNWSQHVFVDPDQPRNSYRRCVGDCACVGVGGGGVWKAQGDWPTLCVCACACGRKL